MTSKKHESAYDANEDAIYGSSDLKSEIPKKQFPEPERDPRRAFAIVRDELMLDGNAHQNLATFCQTWEEPELHQLMDTCIDKNMVDKDEYPQMQPGRRLMTPEEVLSRCDENPMGF